MTGDLSAVSVGWLASGAKALDVLLTDSFHPKAPSSRLPMGTTRLSRQRVWRCSTGHRVFLGL